MSMCSNIVPVVLFPAICMACIFDFLPEVFSSCLFWFQKKLSYFLNVLLGESRTQVTSLGYHTMICDATPRC